MLRVCVRFLPLLIAVALSLAGCIVPIPSVPGKPPYKDVTPRLTVGATTCSEVVALLGEPPIRRAGGRLIIYGASRETAARLLGITIVPMTIPLEEFHFLFLEFDDADVLQRSELVIAPDERTQGCDSLGRCLMHVEWNLAGVVPVWMWSGNIEHGNLAVVSTSLEQEALVRRMEPPETGCRIYLFGRDRKPQWYEELAGKTPGSVYLALDGHPRYADPMRNSTLFAAWNATAGRHMVHATTRDGKMLADFPVECTTGALVAVVAETVPTVMGIHPQVEFTMVTKEEAEVLMTGRRLVLE